MGSDLGDIEMHTPMVSAGRSAAWEKGRRAIRNIQGLYFIKLH